ncbi:glycoside hydrolase family 85 protein [Karstenula rhodostoma CBS 690.94]|uniref:Glycoside hydrolase family 85 protein n=1 Tax=Karstenula rhodostoma CBS 690.94 TaxID=1392251 RepID=A0A9P4UAV8_9PLEO|nr:glycoside hydrolase family 85 protein [Karstenula rhodostoma CBS 690.94]
MAYLAGWKDILRPIRDGYRHWFPSPDTGPTPEEREKQRRLDRLKGFTYFDTFHQLEAWTEADSDPVQRANTPLLARPSPVGKSGARKANVLICHDYSGNYHEYESASAVGLDEDGYCCEYLQYVESFIYFSHKLVCVPPPSWINTLHRNGVKAFGTVLIEPQTKDTERLLNFITEWKNGQEKIKFPLAKQLSDIARHYGFDGWLINIEKPFPQDSLGLNPFLRQLKGLIGPNKELIWYDALTKDNKISYQNGLNGKNIDFSATCGAVLTNYCWKETDASASKVVALKNGLPTEKVYFGIDVWAQNTVDFGLPRTTYPENKGGGTNTGVAVSKLAEMGLSAGVFGPAWSFEHFPSHGRDTERAMWEGEAFWDGATCSCRGEASFCHPVNLDKPITGSATQYPAGSEKFFHTDFSRAFATHEEQAASRLYNGKKIHSQLGSQSLLPCSSHALVWDSRIPIDAAVSRLKVEKGSPCEERDQPLLSSGGASYNPDAATKDRIFERDLPLFKLDMPADGSLRLYMSCDPRGISSVYLKFSSGIKLLPIGGSGLQPLITFQCAVEPDQTSHGNIRLQELGVRVRSSGLQKPRDSFLKIYKIRIVPRTCLDLKQKCSIEDVQIEQRGEDDTEHWRLRWTYKNSLGDDDRSALATSEIPYSDITGPFSYFAIQIDGVDLGRAYALEHVLPKAFVESFGGGVQVVLIGIGFDGEEVARREQEIVLPVR